MSSKQQQTQSPGQQTASVTDDDMKKLLVSDTPDDDNKLVTREDLQKTEKIEKIEKSEQIDIEPVKSLWSDPERLSKLRQEMQVLSKVRIPVEQIPEGVILKAMAEVLAELSWSDYESFSMTIKRILTGPPKAVPFAVKTRNQRTGKMDFWLIRVFINVGEANKEYQIDVDGTMRSYNKRDVLMSHQFCDYLRDFCRTELHDEAQFWTFTGTYRNKQHLDITKLNQDDMNALKKIGETNPNNLVMIQMKKHVPEIFVGGARKQVGTEGV